jgi:hypothetical protein
MEEYVDPVLLHCRHMTDTNNNIPLFILGIFYYYILT